MSTSQLEWQMVRIYVADKRVLNTCGGNHYMTDRQYTHFSNKAEPPDRFWIFNGFITFDRPASFRDKPDEL